MAAAHTQSPIVDSHDESDSDYKISTPCSPIFSPLDSEAETDTHSFRYSLDITDDGEEDDDDDLLLASPAPSVYSLTESLIQNSFRAEYGRELQNYSDIYQLPADTREIDRLNKQHELLKLLTGKYPPALPEILAPAPGMPKAVLDLGCGSGSWLIDIARDFPHVDCVGVDLVPLQAPNLPPNIRTEVDDINLGLEHFYGQFDVVNMRLISAGIKDYAGLIDQISRVLRPGGLLIALECDFRVYDEDCEPYYAGPGSAAYSKRPIPAIAQYLSHARNAIRARGGHVDAGSLLHVWASQHKAFEDVDSHKYFFPMCQFDQPEGDTVDAKTWKILGEQGSEDSAAFVSSGRPLLLKSGMLEEDFTSLEAQAKKELSEDRTPVYILNQDVWARRKMPPSPTAL